MPAAALKPLQPALPEAPVRLADAGVAIPSTPTAPPLSAAEPHDRRGPFRPERLLSTRSRVAGRNLSLLFRLADAAVILAMAAVAVGLAIAPLADAPLSTFAPFALSAAVMIWSLHVLQAYGFRHRETLGRHLVRILAAAGLAAVLLAIALTTVIGLAGFGQRLGLWFLMAFSGVYLLHLGWWTTVRSWRAQGRLVPNIVIVGATKNADRLIENALASGEVAVLGVFDDRAGRAPKTIRGVPMLGDVSALIGHRIMPYVDKVVVAVPTTAQHRVRQIVERLCVLPNPITLFIDVEGQTRAEIISRIADTPLAYVSGHPDDDGKFILKRAQDLVFGIAALVLILPLMGMVALAVRLDSPGPILFRQKRHGFNNEAIVVWKFRSMRIEASDPEAKRQVEADDVRVTRVGRVIRQTSLDELPQIFNVLKGEMSLVGPRPHAIGMMTGDAESAELVAEYAHRHRMKPGMTGWAAIKGSRGPVDTPELVRRRVALDIEYIERQSFWLDLFIMAMTIPCLLGDREAVR
ncbi:polysaccharide biosynthesis protein HfsE [soil metagenome]